MGPLLTSETIQLLSAARRSHIAVVDLSLDLNQSVASVSIGDRTWSWRGRNYGYPNAGKPRTIYYWNNDGFAAVARFADSLVKLVPTTWGPPTFEIDGIKMLPTAKVSPCIDAERKVGLIRPRGKAVLDTCGGLGYFAACCLRGGASKVLSYEINADVIWLRSLNPWSPAAAAALTLTHADITQEIGALPAQSFDAVLHDPPRFGIAGDLYSQQFYSQLSRVLKRRGRLFHYTGAPNKQSSGRELAHEVANRLRIAGFTATKEGDGVLAVKT